MQRSHKEKKDETVARKKEETKHPILSGEQKRRGQHKRVPQGKSPGVTNVEVVKRGKLHGSALPPGRLGARGCWEQRRGVQWAATSATVEASRANETLHFTSAAGFACIDAYSGSNQLPGTST